MRHLALALMLSACGPIVTGEAPQLYDCTAQWDCPGQGGAVVVWRPAGLYCAATQEDAEFEASVEPCSERLAGCFGCRAVCVSTFEGC